jgi:hypothetical protein
MDSSNSRSQVDYFLVELEWRFDQLCDGIWELIEVCEDLKAEWEYDPSPRPPREFDPLQTIG